MKFVGAFAGAVIGMTIGAGVWLIVLFAAKQHGGWMAIPMGGIIGIGTSLGGRGLNGMLGGITALIVAVASILFFKLVIAASIVIGTGGMHERDEWVISNLVQIASFEQGSSGAITPEALDIAATRFKEMPKEEIRRYRAYPPAMCPERAKVYMAEQVADEYYNAGRTINWPNDADQTTAWLPQHFPKELWTDVEQRWNSMTPAARQHYVDSVENEVQMMVDMYYNRDDIEDPEQALIAVFGPLDLLFILAGVGAAFMIGTRTDQ